MLPVIRATPAPKNVGLEGECVVVIGVGGAEDRFNDECLGGDGGRVEEWCVALVKRRDTDAVAVDVPDDATGGGVRGKKAGAFRR